MAIKWAALLGALLCWMSGVQAESHAPASSDAQPLVVIFPEYTGEHDVRQINGYNFLSLALEHSGVDYRLQYSSAPMSRRRMERELETGRLVNVGMFPATDRYDATYLKVGVAVDKGLLGQRVHLVSDESRHRLAAVETLDDLKSLTGCTGAAWRITALFEQHGFNLLKVEDYELLFVHLARQGCDYISRGVMEITSEWETYSKRYPNLRIDPHLLVQTPLINHFYVTPGKERLRRVLEDGFANAMANGAYEELFNRLYGEQLESLNLEQRRVLRLEADDP